MTRTRWLAVVVAMQALMLLGWAGYHEWNRATARTILLETQPVDPRDLLRGDYMILSYKIGTVPLPEGPDRNAPPGREIWVRLRPAGRFYEVEATSWTEIEDTDAGIVVRGRIGRTTWRGNQTVDYGIEKFFVPEGQGRPMFKEMVVEATVSPSHGLGIKRLLLDGQPYPR
jgi:uncharacterized membrane-anchored protein